MEETTSLSDKNQSTMKAAPPSPLDRESPFGSFRSVGQAGQLLQSTREQRTLTKEQLIAPICEPGNWMQIAGSEMAMGVKEVKGKNHNSQILEYHGSTNLVSSMAKKDETPWCSSFTNWAMEKAGYEGTNSAGALSWKKWGQDAKEPVYGAVAVIDYGKGKGHVGFVAGVSEDKNTVYLLGGNQSNEVKISAFSADKVKTYRMPDSVDPATFSAAPTVANQQEKNLGLKQTR